MAPVSGSPARVQLSKTAEGSTADELRQALAALSALAASVADCPRVGEPLATACEEAERQLGVSEIGIVVAGPRKRSLLNALAGAEIFAATTREATRAIVAIRRGAAFRFVARHADERVEESESVASDRAAFHAEDVREVRVEAARAITTTAPPPISGFTAFWSWLWRTLLGLVGRKALAPAAMSAPVPTPPPTVIDADVEIGATTEAAAHGDERRAKVLEEIRALLDPDRRGHDLVGLAIDVTDGALPEDIVLLDAPALLDPNLEVGGWHWRHVRGRAKACLVAGGAPTVAASVAAPLAQTLSPIAPHVLADVKDNDAAFLQSATTELPRILAHVRAEAPLTAIAMTAADLRRRLDALATAAEAVSEEIRARIADLEASRAPDPATFRAVQKERLRGPIEFAARRILRRALENLRTRAAKLEAEWLAAIDASTSRAKVVASVASIEAEGGVRLEALADGSMDEIGRELQAVSETLLTWVLEEVARQYRAQARSKGGGETGVLMLTEVTSEDEAGCAAPALAGTVADFDRRRVAIGLGGAAAGAAAGTALVPIVGTAIGAFVGVFVGFLWPVKKLQAACAEAVRRHVEGVAREIETRIEQSYERFAADIEAAVDDSLGDALGRRREAIERLMNLERETLARETDKLGRLERLGPALAGQSAALGGVAERAAQELRDVRSRGRA